MNYLQAINEVKSMIEDTEFLLKNTENFLETDSYRLTKLQQNKLINHKIIIEVFLTEYYKKAEEINIEKMLHDAEKNIYSTDNNSCHLQWVHPEKKSLLKKDKK
jgi:sulfur relay (sulfurtransferase) DsrC/TusE family protein